ncbi:MAG: ATP-binding protein [Clostridia bacterium]|nr:ATP-binding protein [Clostridia bacterium]
MAYSKRIFNKVTNDFQDKRNEKKRLLHERETEIYQKIPNIEKIDADLRKFGLKLTRSVMGGAEVGKSVEEIRKESQKLSEIKCEELVKNGFEPDYLLIKYDCDLCKDEGYIDGVMCKCFEKAIKEEAYKYSNLPLMMDERTFEDFNLELYPDDGTETSPKNIMEAVFEYCKEYAFGFNEKSENLLLYGGTGLGKTFMSSCIAKTVLEKGYSVFYQPAYKIFPIFEELRFGDRDKEILRMQIDEIFKTDLLIIDDLGTELTTSYTAEVFFDLLNSRMNDKKKTIINTNLSLSDMQGVYSERITSRIIGNFTQLKFYGEDIRTNLNS